MILADRVDLFGSADLYPLRFSKDWLYLKFIGMSDESYRRSAFLDDRIFRVDSDEILFHVASLLDYRSRSVNRSKGRVHYILHSAFCCSTLFARLLEGIPRTLVLKEPWVLTQMQWLRLAGDHSSTPWAALLDLALGLLTRSGGEQTDVVIKASDVCLPIGRQLLDWDAASSCTFVYSDLPTFVLQVMKASERHDWIYNRATSLRSEVSRLSSSLGGVDPKELRIPEVCAYVWGAYMLCYRDLRHSVAPERLITIRDTSIADTPMEALEGWIALAGIEVNNQDRFEAIRINRMHSKDNVPFAAVDRRSALDAVAALYSGGVAQALRWLSTWIPSLEDVARGNAQP